MTKVLIYGCNGYMGRVLQDLIKDMEDITIVAGVDMNPVENGGFPVFTSIEDVDTDVDVIIDFSAAAAVDQTIRWAAQHQVALVECTTGLSEETLDHLKTASEKTAILRSANMSLGVNTLLSLVKTATQVLGQAGFDIEIVEKHHRRKLDAPSGTAIALADAINEAAEGKYEYCYGRSERRQARPDNEIGISAVRGGTIVGEHSIIFAGTDEVIELKHTAYSRAIFGKGAIEAAVFLKDQQAGLYDMSDVIGAKA